MANRREFVGTLALGMTGLIADKALGMKSTKHLAETEVLVVATQKQPREDTGKLIETDFFFVNVSQSNHPSKIVMTPEVVMTAESWRTAGVPAIFLPTYMGQPITHERVFCPFGSHLTVSIGKKDHQVIDSRYVETAVGLLAKEFKGAFKTIEVRETSYQSYCLIRHPDGTVDYFCAKVV